MADVHAILTAEITPASGTTFVQFLMAQAATPPDKLILAMNCPGGNVVAGIAIYNTMIAMPYPITTLRLRARRGAVPDRARGDADPARPCGRGRQVN
jgi:ATP-dependent protease ClpP protease subunit